MGKLFMIAVEICAVVESVIMVLQFAKASDTLCLIVAIMFLVCAIIAHRVQSSISWGE